MCHIRHLYIDFVSLPVHHCDIGLWDGIIIADVVIKLNGCFRASFFRPFAGGGGWVFDVNDFLRIQKFEWVIVVPFCNEEGVFGMSNVGCERSIFRIVQNVGKS